MTIMENIWTNIFYVCGTIIIVLGTINIGWFLIWEIAEKADDTIREIKERKEKNLKERTEHNENI